jgi:hypothetical protein
MVDLLDALHLDLEPRELRKRIQVQRLVDVVANEFEIGMLQEVVDVGFLARDEGVDTDHAAFAQ